jgi:hypothetical protein
LKKLLTAILVISSILVIVLGVLSSNPIVSCDIDIPQESLAAVKSESEGLYSSKLPLVPIYVEVSDYSDGIVYYTISYFPFGSVDLSFSDTDGYNIEKPLSRLS